MVLSNNNSRQILPVVGAADGQPPSSGHARLDRDFLAGSFPAGQILELQEIGTDYQMDQESVLRAFAEYQSLGMIAFSGTSSAIVQSPNPKEMQEAYEIRAALEEISGRCAASVLKGNTRLLRRELESMRLFAGKGDLEACAKSDARFHRIIVESSQNDVLLRVWNTLAMDLRIRASISRLAKELSVVVESHQPILDALDKGLGREAGLLLRNHIETTLEFFKKADSDSGFHRALRKDLEGAKDVQQAFFPPDNLSIPCLPCETFYQPAHDIGGDYYDLISLQAGRWGIAIGDVSGKGIGAALIMASLQASLRAQALHPHSDLSALIADVNRLVFESSPTHFFASLFYAEYEPATRLLRYANAGHNAPIVVRPRNASCEIFRLDAVGMPVGIAANLQFPTTTFQCEVGDVLVAYTDGITEMENPKGEMWGEEMLLDVLRSSSRKDPEEIINSILDALSAFANGRRQRDDMTLVVLAVREGCDVSD
jgi:serine phosphatase RsbU (regulator of sigma subunit)